MSKSTSASLVTRPVVWVMGASRGIGKEIAIQFSSMGYEVCVSSRSKKNLNYVVKEIKNLGGRASSFPCDVSEMKQILATAKQIEKRFFRIDILINNAGITSFKNVEDESLEMIDDILDANLEGPIVCIKAALKGMIKRKQGCIINILSTVAVKTFKGSAAYTAAKEGLFGFAKVLREEVRKYNIKVINILPGATETVMWHPKLREKYGYRMMKPRDVAEAVLSAYRMPDTVVAEDIVLRPVLGDLDA
ncbi:MAG: SDR family oxidoreductase [Bacteroidetes bacterium]|nr:MAG: SDR family oxidoreductase [Bacteroidota bacterium]